MTSFTSSKNSFWLYIYISIYKGRLILSERILQKKLTKKKTNNKLPFDKKSYIYVKFLGC